MTYPDGIDALVNVNATDTLAAGGHAARHNSVNTALVEVKDYLVGALGSKVDYPSGGADGDALIKSGTAAAWGAAGGLTLIASESFSAVSNVSVNGCFTADFASYFLVLTVSGSDSTTRGLSLRLRLSGADATGADYDRQDLQVDNTTVSGSRITSGSSFFVSFLRTTQVSRFIEVVNPNKAQATFITTQGMQFTAGIFSYKSEGRHTLSTEYDGFTLLVDSGTFTGNVKIYGYRD
jgi:hypothetical protein